MYIVRPPNMVTGVTDVEIQSGHKSGILILCEIEVFGGERQIIVSIVNKFLLLSIVLGSFDL